MEWSIPMSEPYRCKDAGEVEGCLIEPDPEWTMDFSDVDPSDPYVYWCSYCGPIQHLIGKALEAKMTDPEMGEAFTEEFRQILEDKKPKH